jgi:hypothetical protein
MTDKPRSIVTYHHKPRRPPRKLREVEIPKRIVTAPSPKRLAAIKRWERRTGRGD